MTVYWQLNWHCYQRTLRVKYDFHCLFRFWRVILNLLSTCTVSVHQQKQSVHVQLEDRYCNHQRILELAQRLYKSSVVSIIK